MIENKSKILPITLAVLGLAAVVVAYQFVGLNYSYKGSVIEPTLKAFDFSLQRANGEVFNLEDQRGKVVVMFFGYANCPDFCPTTLGEFKQVHEALGEDAQQVKFVFITIDPERDSPEQIEKYVSAFHPDFTGLSGEVDELQQIWDAYFVFREKVVEGSEEAYLMNHSTRVIVVDKLGNFRMTFPYGIGVQAMADDIAHLLAE